MILQELKFWTYSSSTITIATFNIKLLFLNKINNKYPTMLHVIKQCKSYDKYLHIKWETKFIF